MDISTSNTPVANEPLVWPEPLSACEWDQRFPGALDAVLVLAGAANVIMQLARPGVAYGVMESRVHSGSLFHRPLKRSRTTFTYLAVALLGSSEEKRAYRDAVNRVHAQVYSTESSPVSYRAFDRNLQLWVAACLYWGLADAREQVRGPMSPAQADGLYHACEPLGTTLQVRAAMWPATRAEFEQWWAGQMADLHIDDAMRAYLTRIADLEFLHPLLSRTFGPFHRFVTAGFLPAPLREQMHFAWGPAEQRRFQRLLRTFGFINRLLPRQLRQWPMYVVLADFRFRLRRGMPLV